MSPCKQVFHALPVWLRPDPQFKVFQTVVKLVAVLVVYVLIASKRAAEMLLHYVPMLKDPKRGPNTVRSANSPVAVGGDVRVLHAPYSTLDAHASAPGSGKGIAVAFESVVVTAAIAAAMGRRNFATFDDAGRSFVRPLVSIAPCTQSALGKCYLTLASLVPANF